ncbi:MAG TPA: hypothetical protein VIV40_04675 [Kofleriaceae bacterium]
MLSLAGCYAPNYGNGELACATDGTCPEGLTCNPIDHRCYKDGSGPTADASSADAPPDALVETVPDVTITFPTDGSTTGAMVPVAFTSSAGAGFTYECTMDSAVATCTSGDTYTLTAGSHTFSVRGVGPFGTKGKSSSVTWNVDTMAATVTISGSPTELSFTTAKTASYTFTAVPSDNVVFECKLDSAAFAACTSPQSASNLAEGQHTFTVKATRLGSVSMTTRTWTVDSLPPSSPSLSGTPANNALVNSAAASFTFSATDANTITYECNRDGAGYTTCTSPQTYSVTGEGTHTFSARAKDPAGNTTTLGSRTWTLDSTPPSTTLAQNIITATNQTTVTFTYSSSEASSTFSCTLDGVARSCTGTSHTISGLSSADHTFSIAAVDPAGNPDPSPATHAFTVTSNPVLRYAFESNATNTGAAANTPISYTGTQMNVSYGLNGKFGLGITFQGTASSYVTLPVSSLIHTGRPYTVSFWYRDTMGLVNTSLIKFPGTNQLESRHANPGNVWTNCVASISCSSFEYPVNNWHNIIYRYAGAGNAVEIYSDGSLINTLGGPAGDLFAALDDPTLGLGGNLTIDEVRFYDQVYPVDKMCTGVIGGTWSGTTCTLP